MPRFERLSSAFKVDPNFQRVVGLFYGDILEFHRRAYKYFRRRGEYSTLLHTYDHYLLVYIN